MNFDSIIAFLFIDQNLYGQIYFEMLYETIQLHEN